MGFDFSGYVLRGATSADSNASTTGLASNGVVRDVKAVPHVESSSLGRPAYTLNSDNGEAPALVELDADQYRTSILNAPAEGTTEYIIWAANSSSMAIITGDENNPVNASGVVDPWVEEGGTGILANGSGLHVVAQKRGWPGDLNDGEPAASLIRTVFHEEGRSTADLSLFRRKDASRSIIVSDKGDRSISGIVGVRVTRGDTGHVFMFWAGLNADTKSLESAEEGDLTNIYEAFESVDPDAGIVTIKADKLGVSYDTQIHDDYARGAVTEDALLDDIAAAFGADQQGSPGLGGGFSFKRGDSVSRVMYFIAPSRFWWTRNDPYETRFGYDFKYRKFRPLKGTGIVKVGALAVETTYALIPPPSGVQVGEYLPGIPGVAGADEYSMVRVGRIPNSGSTPIAEADELAEHEFNGMLVVLDEDVSEEFNFSAYDPPLAGIVGAATGEVFFNPKFVLEYGGQSVWYSYRSFNTEANAFVGKLKGAETNKIPLFISPIPPPDTHPFIHFGSRRPLTPVLVDTDADLYDLEIGLVTEVGVSLTTGQLKFHDEVYGWPDPESEFFNYLYLGTTVYYNGLAMNAISQPIQSPSEMMWFGEDADQDTATPIRRWDMGDNKDIYVQTAQPFGGNGLGVSGVLHVPDGSGTTFDADGKVGTRQGGDNSAGWTVSGLVRSVKVRHLGVETVEVGDSFIFSSRGAVVTLDERDYAFDPNGFFMPDKALSVSQLPFFDWNVTGGRGVVAKSPEKEDGQGWMGETTGYVDLDGHGNFGSAVMLPRKERKRIATELNDWLAPGSAVTGLVYFQQSLFKPSTYTYRARLTSKVRDEFTFVGTEILRFAVNGTPYTWDAHALGDGTFDILEVVESLKASAADEGYTTPAGDSITTLQDEIDCVLNQTGAFVGGAEVGALAANVEDVGGYIILSGYDRIEIGWGPNGTKDLDACAALGLLPGWYAEDGRDNWLSDSGISFGLERSPFNRDRSSERPDFIHQYRVKNHKISPQGGVQPYPVMLVDYPPLEDIPGYGEGVFFQTQNTIKVGGGEQSQVRFLRQLIDVFYVFGENAFLWLEKEDIVESVEAPLRGLPLGKQSIIPESLLGCEPNPNMGLFVAEEGGSFELKVQDDEYLMLDGGNPGVAMLIDRVGSYVGTGGQGEFIEGETGFTNTFAAQDDNFLMMVETTIQEAGEDEEVGTSDDPEPFEEPGPVLPGYKLKILSGDALGWYEVIEVVDEHTLVVTPPFPTSAGQDGDYKVPWEIYDGMLDSEYDPAVVADALFTQWTHLPEEPFKIRTLAPLGNVPRFATQEETRLQAIVSDALISERLISLRFGLDHEAEDGSNVVELKRLPSEELGVVGNNTLMIPGVHPATPQEGFTDGRIEAQAFYVQLGTAAFTFESGLLIAVTDESSDEWDNPGAGSAVAYNPNTRKLRFGTSLLSSYASAVVYVIGSWMPPEQLAPGHAEFHPVTGYLNFSKADMDARGPQMVAEGETEEGGTAASYTLGIPVYFVEQMITTDRIDIACNPIGGAFVFLRPLRERLIVECEYSVADDEGNPKLIYELREDGTVLYNKDTGKPVPELDENGDVIYDEVREFLPLYIRSEEATKVDAYTYSFNPPESDEFQRTAFEDIEPMVWLNSHMLNYGTDAEVEIDFENNLIRLSQEGPTPVLPSIITEMLFSEFSPDTPRVTISYAVLETYGGEKVYNTSKSPIYRPPFFLEKGVDSFVLETDRTEGMRVGMLFRIGAATFYIKDASYDEEADETTVTIFPTTRSEVGSRSPGKDVLSLLSDRPVTLEVDGLEVPETSPQGFLLDLDDTQHGGDGTDDSGIEWEPVSQGSNRIEFQGNLLRFAVPGHLMEIGGYPYLIHEAMMSTDGLKTVVLTTQTFYTGHSMAYDAVRLSVRPIYPPDWRNPLGVNPILASEGFEFVRYGEKDSAGNELPGRTLVLGAEYTIDETSGATFLLAPLEPTLLPNQRILLHYTKVNMLAPAYDPASLTYRFPRFYAEYRYNTLPSLENGLLGAKVYSTYSFHHPDTFYTRIVPVESYSIEAAEEIMGDMSSRQGGQGPMLTAGQSMNEKDVGMRSITTDRSNLTDKDRVARLFLDFYNSVIVAFEQVKECLDGSLVGDRDGKFRYFIGRGKDTPPPGWEDSITGLLNPRNIFSMIYEEESNFPIFKNDWLYDPRYSTMDWGTIDGDWMDAEDREIFMQRQSKLVMNDVDDLVLTDQRLVWVWYWIFLFPIPWPKPKGVFERLSQPNELSRIFPESGTAFFRTHPGLKHDLSRRGQVSAREDWSGWYSILKLLEAGSWSWSEGITLPVFGSTWGKVSGYIENPVVGRMKYIDDMVLNDRFPRARIWDYFPSGIAAGAFGLDEDGALRPAEAIERPCMIATPMKISELPINPETGMPDIDLFMSNGNDGSNQNPPSGVHMDLGTGDFNLITPAWHDWWKGDITIAIGKPSGERLSVIDSGENAPVRVDQILYGCVVTFKDSGGDAITNGSALCWRNKDGDAGLPIQSTVTGSPVTQGDTLYDQKADNQFQEGDFDDPPTADDLEKILDASPDYDYTYSRKKGQLKDRTFWQVPKSNFWEQPWGLNPPRPCTELEAIVTFHNQDIEPNKNLPALLGEDKNDSGDYTLPYLRTTNTELDRFRQLSDLITEILTAKSPSINLMDGVFWSLDDGDGSLSIDDGGGSPEGVFTGDEFLDGETEVPHGMREGDMIYLSSASLVGGTFTGWHRVAKVTTATNFSLALFQEDGDYTGSITDNRYVVARPFTTFIDAWIAILFEGDPVEGGSGVVGGEYIYPDEVRGSDGTIVTELSTTASVFTNDADVVGYVPPAALLTNERHNELEYNASTPGKGNVQSHDILLVEVAGEGVTLPAGCQGLLSVGRIYRNQTEVGLTGDYDDYIDGDGDAVPAEEGGADLAYHTVVEPPRFITQTARGDALRYQLDNYLVHIHGATTSYPSGVFEHDWTAGPAAGNTADFSGSDPVEGDPFDNTNTSGVGIIEDRTKGIEFDIHPDTGETGTGHGRIIFDFSSLGQIELGDAALDGGELANVTENGSHATLMTDSDDTWKGSGGLNRILNTDGNKIVLRIFAREYLAWEQDPDGVPDSGDEFKVTVNPGDELLRVEFFNDGGTKKMLTTFAGGQWDHNRATTPDDSVGVGGSSAGWRTDQQFEPTSITFGSFDGNIEGYESEDDLDKFKCIVIEFDRLEQTAPGLVDLNDTPLQLRGFPGIPTEAGYHNLGSSWGTNAYLDPDGDGNNDDDITEGSRLGSSPDPAVHRSTYKYDFSFSVEAVSDTDAGVDGQSTTAWIDEDRLSFNEVLDLRLARGRGVRHPIGRQDLTTALMIHHCVVESADDAAGVETDIQSNLYINGVDSEDNPVPFTFLERDPDHHLEFPKVYGEGNYRIGCWRAGNASHDGSERGVLRVMPLEGWATAIPPQADFSFLFKIEHFNLDGVVHDPADPESILDPNRTGVLTTVELLSEGEANGGDHAILGKVPFTYGTVQVTLSDGRDDPAAGELDGTDPLVELVMEGGYITGITILNPGQGLPTDLQPEAGWVYPSSMPADFDITVTHVPGNLPIAADRLRFTLIPSTEYHETGTVSTDPAALGLFCRGYGTIRDGSHSIVSGIEIDPAVSITNGSDTDGGYHGGDLGAVVPGDILVIKGGSTAVEDTLSGGYSQRGSIKSGTYVVRHTVDPNVFPDGTAHFPEGDDLLALSLKNTIGSEGWVSTSFPLVDDDIASLNDDNEPLDEDGVVIPSPNPDNIVPGMDMAVSFEFEFDDESAVTGLTSATVRINDLVYFEGSPSSNEGDLTGHSFPVPGGVKHLQVTSGGTGYEVGDTITIAGAGTGATGVVTLVDEDGVITGVRVLNAGSEYTAAATATVVSDDGAAATLAVTVWEDCRIFIIVKANGMNSLVISAPYTALESKDPDVSTKGVFTLDVAHLELFIGADGQPIADAADAADVQAQAIFDEFYLKLVTLNYSMVDPTLSRGLTKNLQVSGMVYFPIRIDSSVWGTLPDNNVVGFRYDLDGDQQAAYGFAGISLATKVGLTRTDEDGVETAGADSATQVYAFDPLLVEDTVDMAVVANLGIEEDNNGAPGDYKIRIYADLMNKPNEFIADVNKPVFKGVPSMLDISDWPQLVDDAAPVESPTVLTPWTAIREFAMGAACILPGDKFKTIVPFLNAVPADVGNEVGASGFWAMAGIFTEPSYPLSAQNYYADYDWMGAPDDPSYNHVRVVDDRGTYDPETETPSVPLLSGVPEDTIGFRFDDGLHQTLSPEVDRAPYSEQVEIEIRRIRRFHGVQETLAGQFEPLRFAYEIRRGIPTAYEIDPHKKTGTIHAEGFLSDAFGFYVDPSRPDHDEVIHEFSGTQLGGFDNSDVNIAPGDTFRLLLNGVLIDETEVIGRGSRIASWDVAFQSLAASLGPKGAWNVMGTKFRWENSASSLRVRTPGITDETFLAAAAAGDDLAALGYSFEIYLRQAPVPHEQSNEQLLDLITDMKIHETKPDYETQLGGYVPAIPLLSTTPDSDEDGLPDGELDPDTGNPKTWDLYANRLYDDLAAPDAGGFGALGIVEGDIILIDIAGTVEGPLGYPDIVERGARPFGDRGIKARDGQQGVTGEDTFKEGHPSKLDDNRGYYTVASVESDHLVLTPGYVKEFSGIDGVDVTFPETVPAQEVLGYAIYPTIHESPLRAGGFFKEPDELTEGQMDLRPTQYAGIQNSGGVVLDSDEENSFDVNDFSIRPFGYKVIRPSRLFTEETIDFVLMVRERMLSFMETLRGPLMGNKTGTYYDFQDENHAWDIGYPAVPESGKGVYHNDLIIDLIGRVDVAPFANDSDCLSLLDRRFWILDTQLDTLTPGNDGLSMRKMQYDTGDSPYTGYNALKNFDFPEGTAAPALVRPVLPDRIDEVLNIRDRFRDLRYTWLSYRTNRQDGLIVRALMFDRDVPKMMREREEFILRARSGIF